MGIPSDSLMDSRPAAIGGLIDRPKLPLPGNSPFFLVHYVDVGGSWEVVEEGMDAPTFVPVLQPFPIRPGAAGVRTVSADEPRSRMYARPLAKLQEQGAVVLPLDFHVDGAHLPAGVAAGPYLRETDAQGGAFYHTAWDTPRKAIRGNAATVDCDRAAYNRWRAALVTSGIIPEPRQAVLDDVRARAMRRLDNVRSATDIPTDMREANTATARTRLDAVKAAKLPQVNPTPSAPKTAKKVTA